MVRDIARTSRSARGNGAIMIAYGIALSEEDADDDSLGCCPVFVLINELYLSDKLKRPGLAEFGRQSNRCAGRRAPGLLGLHTQSEVYENVHPTLPADPGVSQML
jgi:hypothetical protein